MKKAYVIISLLLAIILPHSPLIGQDTYPENLPSAKQTELELYISSAKAYQMWLNDSINIKILDVRTMEEYIFVGHASMAVNISLAEQTDKWDEAKSIYSIEANPHFLDLVNEWAGKNDLILVMCRSGGRSAMAVNLLAKDGFINVYNIIDGFEGDMIKDNESSFYGKRMKNGWKNSGNPWTYSINPDQVKRLNN